MYVVDYSEKGTELCCMTLYNLGMNILTCSKKYLKKLNERKIREKNKNWTKERKKERINIKQGICVTNNFKKGPMIECCSSRVCLHNCEIQTGLLD